MFEQLTSNLPQLNACLNATAAVLLITGWRFIRRGHMYLHKYCMLLAVGVSTAFLCFYLYYHYHHGSTPFTQQGAIRTVYFTILITHTTLAASLIILVPWTLILALRKKFQPHRRIARITFPIWLYVSITGVIVYWMLYEM